MLDSEYSVIKSDVIKRFDCIQKVFSSQYKIDVLKFGALDPVPDKKSIKNNANPDLTAPRFWFC